MMNLFYTISLILLISENINAVYAGLRISTFYSPSIGESFFAYMAMHAIIGGLILFLKAAATLKYVRMVISETNSRQRNELPG